MAVTDPEGEDMRTSYDVIVVGARCAGAPTAMLLARKGYRVLLVDRAGFPSDTVSTHLVHPPGVAALARWGLLDDLVRTGCPPIERYAFDFGPFHLEGRPRPVDGCATAYAPRRTVLDTMLVDAAHRAGAEVRERFTVDGLVVDHGRVVGVRGRSRAGASVVERARVVIGADGWSSRVARMVGAEEYLAKPALQWSSYTYWRDLPVDGFETFIRPHRGGAALPTNDGLTLLIVGWPVAEAAAYKADVEGNYLRTLDLVPDLAERVRAATRVERFSGGNVPNLFRTPFGPGWALVGDAGYVRDPITAQGMSDAFRDAERCVAALDEAFTGVRPFDEALADYQRSRDEAVMGMYGFTTELATLAPPPPALQAVLAAAAGEPAAMDDFASVVAGVLPPGEFFMARTALPTAV